MTGVDSHLSLFSIWTLLGNDGTVFFHVSGFRNSPPRHVFLCGRNKMKLSPLGAKNEKKKTEELSWQNFI